MRSSSFKLSTFFPPSALNEESGWVLRQGIRVILFQSRRTFNIPSFSIHGISSKTGQTKGNCSFFCQGKEVPRTSRCAFNFQYLKTASHELPCISQNLLRCTHCSGCVWRIPDVHKNTVSFYIFYMSRTLCANVKNSSGDKILDISGEPAWGKIYYFLPFRQKINYCHLHRVLSACLFI